MHVNFFKASSAVDWIAVSVLVCIANVYRLTTVTSDYLCVSQPHMINCEDLKVNNFENVIDLFFLII